MTYDYIIVGAGSAGSVLARRLLDRTDGTVLLVESGGPVAGVGSIADPTRWVENIGGPYDHGYAYEPNPHLDGRSMPLARGKALGGSGAINAARRRARSRRQSARADHSVQATAKAEQSGNAARLGSARPCCAYARRWDGTG